MLYSCVSQARRTGSWTFPHVVGATSIGAINIIGNGQCRYSALAESLNTSLDVTAPGTATQSICIDTTTLFPATISTTRRSCSLSLSHPLQTLLTVADCRCC